MSRSQIDTSQYRILVTDDDADARLVMRMMVERDGYQVFEASDGREAIDMFIDVEPDVVLMDVMMPDIDGFTAAERIMNNRRSDETAIVMVTALHDDASIERAFKIGATDYITKPVQWSVLRHRLRRLLRTKKAEDDLRQVIEDQDILHRIDRELGYTLNLERVLNLALDTALRRTGAQACIIGWVEDTTRQLKRLASLGGTDLLAEPIDQSALEAGESPFAPVFSSDQPVHEIEQDALYTRLLLPLLVRGQTAGVLMLEGVMTDIYDQSDLAFLKHLASRTAAAIEKTRIYQRSQDYILQMDRLNQVSTTISSSLNMDDMIQMSARGLTVLIDGSSAFFCSFTPLNQTLTVRANFVVEGADDDVPIVGATFELAQQPELKKRLLHGVSQFQLTDTTLSQELRDFVAPYGYQSGLILPLMLDDNLLGLMVMGESRYTRYFSENDLALARSLGIHITVMLQQANLFSDVKELEELKSEMIRMASHDLKNPLLQIGGYLHLLGETLADQLDEQQQEFVARIHTGVKRMNTLLDDILNLEKVESQRTTAWKPLDVRLIVLEVANNLASQAAFKTQDYHIDLLDDPTIVMGSEVQLRQAFTNLIGNAIKYTPEDGTVTVRAWLDGKTFKFEVEDSGYGIPQDRQDKLFERFYRANTPGTEDIPGTGLGLSLVKSVAERHEGGVWFESEENQGSIFGLWLPLHRVTETAS